jgi:hypothetical protein
LNTQKKSNIKKINSLEMDKKSPIKHANFVAEDNIFLYSLDKSALDTKIKNTNHSVNKSKISKSSNSQAKNNKVKKKGISIKDILEGNFDENLINKKAENRADSNNGSFEKGLYNRNASFNKAASKTNLVGLNINKNIENIYVNKENLKGKIDISKVGRDIIKNDKNKNLKNLSIIPTGKNVNKYGDKKKKDDFYNENW